MEHSMPLNIRNEHVNELAHKLAVRKNVSKTIAVKVALENELSRLDENLTLSQRLKPLVHRISAYEDSGQQADKQFFDDINGND